MPAKTATQKSQPKQAAQPVKAQAKKSVSKSKSPARHVESTAFGKPAKNVEESKVAPAKRKCKFEFKSRRQGVYSEGADGQGAS